MKIQLLPANVRSYLRSGVAITSVTQCVEELVLNSLDAGATCVAVRLDLNCFKVQVVDNGSGVPMDQLEVLGNRFCTSKCHTLEDLDNLCHFGYRGEALSSIRDSCGIFEITTRSKHCSKTYCKIFQNGKSLKVAESAIVRPSVGTTITVHELFSNFPVRQKSMNKNFEMERIREMLEGVALVRPSVSFTLRNDSTGQMVLSTRKCVRVNSTFGQLYGSTKAEMLVEVQGSKQLFRVHGYIGREGHQRKNLQFIYVNGRIVKKSKIHKLLNKLLLNLPALKPKQRPPSNSPQMLGINKNVFSSPPKFSEVYPVYVLEIKCPISEYDITFEPAKTMIEFKDWDTVLECVTEVTTSFLDKENIVVKKDVDESRLFKAVIATEYEKQEKPVISADNMKDVMSSKMVQKAINRGNINVSETSDDTSVRTETLKTPSNSANMSIKTVQSSGNRKIQVETDTESEIETTTTTSSNSSTDDSYGSDIHKPETDQNNSDVRANSQTQEKRLDSKQDSKQNSRCSLSMFRKSIGKFTGRPSKNVNIDESLKKLDKIIPPSSKSSSNTFFSSLQKFRRKVEINNASVETNIIQAEEKKTSSPDLKEDNCERFINTQYRDFSNTIKSTTYNGPNLCQEDIQPAAVLEQKKSIETTIRNTDCRKIISLDLIEAKTRSSPHEGQFKFSPCYNNGKDMYGQINCQKINTVTNSTEGNQLFPSFDKQTGESSFSYVDTEGPDQKSSIIDMEELQSAPHHLSCFKENYQEFDNKLESNSDTYSRTAKCGSKRPCIDSDMSPPEKQFKYTARPLALEELRMELEVNKNKCDRYVNMCNITDCDKIDIDNENTEMSADVNELNNFYYSNVETQVNDLPSRIEHLPENQCCAKGMNEGNVARVADKAENDDAINSPKDDLKENEIGGFIASTQAFSPKLSPQVEIFDESSEKRDIRGKSKTPESMGFSPKDIIEASTPCSSSFYPYESIKRSVEQGIELSEEKGEIKGQDVTKDKEKSNEFSCAQVYLQKEFGTNRFKEENQRHDVSEAKSLITSYEDKTIDSTHSESIPLTQLLKSPQNTNKLSVDIDTIDTDNGLTVAKRTSFSFDDLFSQTLTSSNIDADIGMDKCIVDCDKELKDGQCSNACSYCVTVTTPNNSILSSSCTEKGDNIGIDDVERRNEARTDIVGETEKEDYDNLWADSQWDISDSSFYLRDEIKLNMNDEHDEKEQDYNRTDGLEESESSTEMERDLDEEQTFVDDQNFRTMDSLNVWYKNLDAGVSATSNILQSNKPSDIVRKMHACRFSKKSLKSVKVLGQLDKKFIACLINTEQQETDPDMKMLVLIDQHAAHERIRLEILNEDAFENGVKGGQLAPFVVSPPQSMTFAEHEIRTVLTFLDGYQKLGIRMKKSTATSVLISSVPASLVDREKNNKIYWSTIQVLIREYIAVFMSTQVCCGVLPLTIHKVLCSLACHGAIKFGDKLSLEECEKLIKDLSRCDLPFQCAHGRPSVTPLFHIDKLQSLSHNKVQGKPKLWRLRQALKLKSK